ncbi:MAG: cob(I)alamin adenosyltransferase [Petroclostridium sp.]|jgi:cob(I)alamin adenosyltransferase|uniref:cob(I)yrinic acid a,c-diamide adenosyltransferase n=1 Tax=Petroclostridium xylanilyticum TaxID=1792311 RepID=UPI000B9964F0|nr:cob(I)yrinic acid a,c-diamide adenosyltransferase [Petroclostridium xylanilyticum]MBZ4646356.1 cob(I)yrinic acid a,c-diamide adenosyltransferase [Clostridia bacterium]MDK2811117.1 cob(I)alamin adenosyltransferase [Petroclostridium sp.]
MLKGLVQVYTGNGKGKTTAAIGQGFRSAGRGLKVYMIQFLKSSDTGELHSAKKLGEIFKIFRFEKERGFFWNLNEEEKMELKKEVHEAFEFAQNVIQNGECDILILDEIMGAIHNKLIDEKLVCDFIQKKPAHVEIILTGRNAPQCIIDLADYVSEIVPVKHPMEKGIGARKGIEY